jgi:hypothetical protein
MDTRAAAATGVRVPLSLHPPGNRRGFVAPADCVLPHVNSLSTDVVSLCAVLLAAFTLRSWGYEISVQSGLRNSPYIRARQHRCCECLARDCSAGFNEELISRLGQTGGPAGRRSRPHSPRWETGGVFLSSALPKLAPKLAGFFFTQL